MVLAVVAVVVLLSRRRDAIATIVLGLIAILASAWPGLAWPPAAVASVLRRGGDILIFSALTWVVAHAVYAPGRITSHRLQGAAVLYLSLATIFASAFSLIWELNPSGFTGLPGLTRGPAENATMMYFSLTTLTTTGYGDITPLDPFCPQLGQSGVGPRAILPRYHGCPPRDTGTARSAPMTSTMIETISIEAHPPSTAQRLLLILSWLPGYRRD